MGKLSILNKYHKKFLELVVKEPYLLKNFYWTGGTVLSEFYLHHRDSYDIDLFSEKEVHLPSINKFVSIAGKQLKARSITHRRFLGLHTYIFKLPKTELKVDFNYYPYPRINLGKKWKGLAIDSLEDIAVNKVHTVSTKARARDFVDIYFIFKKEKFELDWLINLAKAKFDWHIDPIQLGETFTEVIAYEDVPKMIVPFDKKEMEEFFLKLAKSLEKEIFK